MQGLYAIVDVEALERRGLEPIRFARALCEVPLAAMQLRDKRCRATATLDLLRALRDICGAAGVPLYANDRPDLAALAGCAGVHVGQHDLPVPDARRVMATLLPAARVGVSVHSEAELSRALPDAPDYVALGPVFATASKARLDPVIGLDGLARLAARVDDRPTVAIGGIDASSAARVARLCPCVAVIGALLPDASGAPYDAVRRKAAELHQALASSHPPWTPSP